MVRDPDRLERISLHLVPVLVGGRLILKLIFDLGDIERQLVRLCLQLCSDLSVNVFLLILHCHDIGRCRSVELCFHILRCDLDIHAVDPNRIDGFRLSVEGLSFQTALHLILHNTREGLGYIDIHVLRGQRLSLNIRLHVQCDIAHGCLLPAHSDASAAVHIAVFYNCDSVGAVRELHGIGSLCVRLNRRIAYGHLCPLDRAALCIQDFSGHRIDGCLCLSRIMDVLHQNVCRILVPAPTLECDLGAEHVCDTGEVLIFKDGLSIQRERHLVVRSPLNMYRCLFSLCGSGVSGALIPVSASSGVLLPEPSAVVIADKHAVLIRVIPEINAEPVAVILACVSVIGFQRKVKESLLAEIKGVRVHKDRRLCTGIVPVGRIGLQVEPSVFHCTDRAGTGYALRILGPCVIDAV